MKKSLIVILIILGGQSVFSQIVTVTNLNDNGAGSLREALTTATGGEIVQFDPSLANGTIYLTSGELSPAADLTIDGQTHNITIDGNGSFRILHPNGVNLDLYNLTLMNGASGQGSAVYIEGGGNLQVQNVDIFECVSWNDAGAVRSFGGSHTFRNVTFAGCSASFWGGAYYSLFATTYMENVLFSGNNADRGGAAFFRGNTTLVNCTFSGNDANSTGGAMYIYVNTVVNVDNCIYWNNQSAGTIGDLDAFFAIDNGSTVDLQISNSDIEGSGGSISWNAPFGSDNGGNIDNDPIFVNPLSPSASPTAGGSYELDLGSPCQNLGNNAPVTMATDLADHVRIRYGIVDMGCYEICKTVSTISPVVCSSYTSPSGNYVWTSSGVYLDTLSNYLGCDSVITVNLSVNDSYDTVVTTVCDQYTGPSGTVYNTSGPHDDVSMNYLGCDSLVHIILTVNNSTTNSISPVVCDSYTVPSGDETYTSSGVYEDTLTNAMGCDSIITINLTVNYETTSTITPVVCETYTVPSGDETYTSSGTYTDTIPNTAGCDSVITILLSVNYNSTSTINPVVCETYTVPSGTATYTSSGTYNDTIPNFFGCDSVITINLTVNYPSTSVINPTVCDSYTVPSGDETYFVSGSYTDTIPNYLGCDSVITINLNVIFESTATINPVACYNYLSPSGLYNWTMTGTYNDTIPNAAGCDSVITVNLTINSETYGNMSDVACYSYTSPSGNYTYNSSGVYNDTIPNAAGCDSIITLDLIIHNATYDTINPSDCYSYTSPSGNYTWTTSGTYTDTIPNINGCDSVITINLSINSTANALIEQACYEYISPSGQIWTTSGVYLDTIPNTVGCDSLIAINLTIINLDVSTTLTDDGQTINANTTTSTYQWLNCDDGMTIIDGETDQFFYPPNTGTYAVEITENGCVDTSECVAMDIFEVAATVFSPNGDGVNDVFVLKLEDPVNKVVIFNRWGDEIASFENYNDIDVAWDGSDQNGDVISGTYYYIIETTTRKYSGWVQVLK